MHINNCSIVPAKSEHAVQAVVFVCELSAALSLEAAKKILAHYESSPELQRLFPKKSESRNTSISLVTGNVDVRSNDNITGVNFERVNAEGNVELALICNGPLISFVCNDYSRWKSVSTDAIKLLEQFVGYVLPEPGISVFGLQYIDEFFIAGELNNFVPSMLFAENCSLLPPNILSQQDGWHAHVGWFEQGDNGGKLLTNLRVNSVKQPERTLIQIVSAHRDILSKPITDLTNVADIMSNSFEALHSKNKNLFRQLLNEQMKREIHLENLQ